MASRQSQHATQEERIPSGIVGARIRQLQRFGKVSSSSNTSAVDDQLADAATERDRENTKLG